MGELSCAWAAGEIKAVASSAVIAKSSVFMFHSTIFANPKTFAGGLKFLGTHVFLFATLQAFGRRLMCCGHGAVALGVFFGIFSRVLRYAMHSCSRN
jgi:hypothetical protein